MIAELGKTDQHNLLEFFKALTQQDGENLAHTILNMSERHTCKVGGAHTILNMSERHTCKVGGGEDLAHTILNMSEWHMCRVGGSAGGGGGRAHTILYVRDACVQGRGGGGTHHPLCQ